MTNLVTKNNDKEIKTNYSYKISNVQKLRKLNMYSGQIIPNSIGERLFTEIRNLKKTVF